jgi:C1A family cysteine protease
MAALQPLDLAALRVELTRSGARWASSDTTITQLEEKDRRRLLGVPLPATTEVDRLITQAQAIAPSGGNGNGNGAARAAGAGDAVGLATYFNARNVGGADYTTPIRNQGGCGSCVAFGTLGAIETTAAFQRGQPDLNLDLSEQHLFFVLGPPTGASCANGWWPANAYAALQATGVTFEDYMPYSAGGGGSLNPDWPNRLAKITGYQTLTSNVAAIKQHLVTHGAVTACFIVYQDFFSYGGGVYHHVSGAQAGGHCVTIVGYDDSAGCWIAKNSWGTGWGEAGWFRIAYGECAIETWGVFGADYVNLRMWIDALVRGLYSHESQDSAWAYMDNLGWARLAYGAAGANLLMLNELTSARLRNTAVRAFHDNGQLTTAYVF